MSDHPNHGMIIYDHHHDPPATATISGETYTCDIVEEEDTVSGETTPGHDHKEQLSVVNMEVSDKDFVGEEDTDSGETTPVHDYDNCIKEQQAQLYIEDSDKETTSDDEMDRMFCGPADFDQDYMDLLQAHQKYFPSPKPLTWEEWDAILTKKEMEGNDLDLEDLWYSNYPPKEDSEYSLVWSDTDE